jgi:hypothetical protein
MAVLEHIGERLEGRGWIGVGIGAVILAPVLLKGAGRVLRPAAKGAIKGYLALSEVTRRGLGQAGEQMYGLVAEARTEFATRGNGDASDQPTAPARRGSRKHSREDQQAADPA